MQDPSDKKTPAGRADRGRRDHEPPKGASDAEVLDGIYRAHMPAVLRHLRAGFGFKRADGSRGVFQVRSAFDAEEICHEAFAAFVKQWVSGGFDRSRPPLPYILRIASHAALRHGRKSAAEVLVDEPLDGAAPLRPQDPELRRLLELFYAQLEPGDQAVFDACVVDELSQAKAGDQLGQSRDQVYRGLTRVRRKALAFFKGKGWLDGT